MFASCWRIDHGTRQKHQRMGRAAFMPAHAQFVSLAETSRTNHEGYDHERESELHDVFARNC